jgi:ribose 5-phosphate isomerase B
MTKIYLGADHGGFVLKEKIKGWLTEWKYEFEDMGAYSLDPKDDYTLFAEKVASIVGKGQGRGVLLCKSGVGVEIVANKFDGVRASLGKSAEQVRAGRNDDDMNILVIAAEFTDDEEAKKMLKAFLETPFAGKDRYKKRIADISKLEANN